MSYSPAAVQYRDNEISGLDQSLGSKPVAISFRLLLAIYGVIPIVVLVMLVDSLFLNSRLKAIFPNSPYDWWIVLALFNFPHIFASQFSLVDREYLSRYRRLLWATPLVVLLGLVLALLDEPVGLLIFELITIYHVIFQQVGITRLMMGKVNDSFNLWRWFLLGAFAFAYGGLVLDAKYSFFVATVGPLLIPTTYLAYRAAKNSQTEIGKHYLWANQTMLLTVAACFSVGYPVFSVLIPRMIHDISAFVFYVVHDTNRNRFQMKNALFRCLSIVPISVGFMGPLLALTVNLLLQTFTGLLSNPFFFMPFTMIHYHTERVVWRGHNMHRKSLAFRS